MPGDAIHAAPALHGVSRTLLAITADRLYMFRDLDALAGEVPPPRPFSGAELLMRGMQNRLVTVEMGSPLALTFDHDMNEIVAYTNFRVIPLFGYQPYGLLGAFALPAIGRSAPRPLWCRPLAVTATGILAPGPGTFGQPALFRYKRGSSEAT